MKVEVYDVISDVAKQINNKFKYEVARPGREDVKADVGLWVPTDSVLLNLLFGDENYGVSTGRILEIFGDFSHGKSTIAQLIMNAFQRRGGISNLLDSESGWDRKRAVLMGHNPDRHITVEVDTVEAGFDVIYSLNKEYMQKFGKDRDGIPILFVWDTIAASQTEDEKKDDEFGSGMTYKPRLIRRRLRQLCGELAPNNAQLVIVNQTIQDIKPNYTGIKSTPGGGGIKFWSSQRLQVERIGTFSDWTSKRPAGILSECKMVKNKLGAPFRSAVIPINYRYGLDKYREIYSYHLDNTNVLNLAGSYKQIVGFEEKPISFYEKDFPKVLASRPGLYEYLVEEAKAHWASQAPPPPPYVQGDEVDDDGEEDAD